MSEVEVTESVPPVQVAKAKRGRGPTVARWQVCCGAPSDSEVTVMDDKYTSEQAALKAIENTPIENAVGLFRRIETKTKVVARLV
jgi:hypothetical protein